MRNSGKGSSSLLQNKLLLPPPPDPHTTSKLHEVALLPRVSVGLLVPMPQHHVPSEVVEPRQFGVTHGALVHLLLAAVHVLLVPRQGFDTQVSEAVGARRRDGTAAAGLRLPWWQLRALPWPRFQE